jgi:hypothetical protein
MILCGAGVEDDANLGAASSFAKAREELLAQRRQAMMPAGDDDGEQPPGADIKGAEELLDLHVLVSDGVEALLDPELPREAGDRVLVDADPVARCLADLRLCLVHESEHGADRRSADEAAERVPTEDLLAAGEDRKADVVEGLEVKDPRDAQDRFEEQ